MQRSFAFNSFYFRFSLRSLSSFDSSPKKYSTLMHRTIVIFTQTSITRRYGNDIDFNKMFFFFSFSFDFSICRHLCLQGVCKYVSIALKKETRKKCRQNQLNRFLFCVGSFSIDVHYHENARVRNHRKYCTNSFAFRHFLLVSFFFPFFVVVFLFAKKGKIIMSKCQENKYEKESSD